MNERGDGRGSVIVEKGEREEWEIVGGSNIRIMIERGEKGSAIMEDGEGEE